MCGFWDIADLGFHICIFMQKLTRNSSGKNNKSCRIIHNGSNKIVSHFSDFSTIFYAIYKNQPNHKYYLSYPFAVRTSERTLALQCGPWARLAGAGEQNSSEVRRGLAGEGWGKGLGATRFRFGVLDRGGAAPASGSPAAREYPVSCRCFRPATYYGEYPK
jgi:hypothetical protein